MLQLGGPKGGNGGRCLCVFAHHCRFGIKAGNMYAILVEGCLNGKKLSNLKTFFMYYSRYQMLGTGVSCRAH